MITKHLPGRHDQQDHGRSREGTIEGTVRGSQETIYNSETMKILLDDFGQKLGFVGGQKTVNGVLFKLFGVSPVFSIYGQNPMPRPRYKLSARVGRKTLGVTALEDVPDVYLYSSNVTRRYGWKINSLEEMARRLSSLVSKHLPGKHDQKTHGRFGPKSQSYPDKASAAQAAVELKKTTKVSYVPYKFEQGEWALAYATKPTKEKPKIDKFSKSGNSTGKPIEPEENGVYGPKGSRYLHATLADSREGIMRDGLKLGKVDREARYAGDLYILDKVKANEKGDSIVNEHVAATIEQMVRKKLRNPGLDLGTQYMDIYGVDIADELENGSARPGAGDNEHLGEIIVSKPLPKTKIKTVKRYGLSQKILNRLNEIDWGYLSMGDVMETVRYDIVKGETKGLLTHIRSIKKHLPGQHDQKTHGVEGSGQPDLVVRPDTVPAGQFDKAAWEAKSIPERIDAWKQLSTNERDVLADADNSIANVIRDRLDFAGPRPTEGTPDEMIKKRLEQIGEFIAPDAKENAQKHLSDLSGYLSQSGVDEVTAKAVLLDATDALVVQENESMRRVLGDHGVRHLLGDADMAMQVMQQVPGYDTPQTKASLLLTAIYHDAGYLTEPSQIFLDGDHPRWSGQHFESNVRPMVEKALGGDITDHIDYMIDTHAGTLLDWQEDPVSSAFRVADNMALFYQEKLPGLFHYIPENISILEKVGTKELTVDQARQQILTNVSRSNLSSQMKDALTKSALEMNSTSPKTTLGMMGGKIGDISWNGSGIDIKLERNSEAKRLQNVLDLGQRQFSRFGEAFGINPKDFESSSQFDFIYDNKVRLRAFITGIPLKALTKSLSGDKTMDDFFETIHYDEPIEVYRLKEGDYDEEVDKSGTTESARRAWETKRRKGMISRKRQKEDIKRGWSRQRQALAGQYNEAVRSRNAKAAANIKRRVAAGDKVYSVIKSVQQELGIEYANKGTG